MSTDRSIQGQNPEQRNPAQDYSVMFSCGEASGDMHCAAALTELAGMCSRRCTFFGKGGADTAALGAELLVDIGSQSVMGVVEVLYQLRNLRRQLTLLKAQMTRRRPDLLLLVDYPGFNMSLASHAHSLGIPVLYYIAPKVWASRPGRIDKLKNTVDHMAVILPFEEKIYKNADIPVTYVGNPLLDNRALLNASNHSKVEPRKSLDINNIRIALMPGSRKHEIDYIMPVILESAKKLATEHSGVRFLLPLASTVDRRWIENHMAGYDLNVELVSGGNYNALASCDSAIVASGTATLELAILSIPMVVVYRLNPLSYLLVKRILLIRHVSLVNVIAEDMIVQELLQDDATAENIAQATGELLFDQSLRQQQISRLATLTAKLGQGGAASKTGGLMLKLLDSSASEAASAAAS